MSKGPVSNFIEHHYRHFNAAALMDAAKGYVTHLEEGGKMMVTLAGAMSTAELGVSLAEMIRQDKIHIISCTGANLEEDIMNLVAHSHYKRIPHYRDLTPQQEWVQRLVNGELPTGNAHVDRLLEDYGLSLDWKYPLTTSNEMLIVLRSAATLNIAVIRPVRRSGMPWLAPPW